MKERSDKLNNQVTIYKLELGKYEERQQALTQRNAELENENVDLKQKVLKYESITQSETEVDKLENEKQVERMNLLRNVREYL